MKRGLKLFLRLSQESGVESEIESEMESREDSVVEPGNTSLAKMMSKNNSYIKKKQNSRDSEIVTTFMSSV